VSQTTVPGPPKKKRKLTKKTPKTDTPTTQSIEAQQPASAVAQTPPASPQEAQPAPVPSLGQMLTDDQRRDYETHIHDALERARANLRKARGNTKLTEAQQRMASQVETFVAQAEDRSKTDLVSARSLAERADLLAKDLAESLQ
jgi:hypothetical protein